MTSTWAVPTALGIVLFMVAAGIAVYAALHPVRDVGYRPRRTPRERDLVRARRHP